MKKSIIIIEGEEDISQLNNFDVNKVICFDYNAHKILETKKIKHELVENYLDKKDEQEIDEITVKIVTNWYKQEYCKKELEFNGLNIGELAAPYLLQPILEAIRRMVGLKCVIETEKPTKITCGKLIKFVKEISKNKILIEEFQSKKIQKSDLVEIPMDLFGKNFNIKIKNKNFLRIKKISEAITKKIVRRDLELRNTNNQKNILLLDFNIIQYFDMIKKIEDGFDNVYLLNIRKPVIWNFESYKKFNKTNTKIINLSEFNNLELEKKIKREHHEISKKLKKILENEQFTQFFIFEDQSFWNPIKEQFIEFMLKQTKQMVEKYYLLNEITNHLKINCILEWAHTGFDERIAVSIANSKKIPVVFLQHALSQHNDKFLKYRPFIPVLPSNNAKQAIWGNIMSKIMEESGIKNEEFHIVGSPRHDKFFKTKKIKTKKRKVLIAITDFLQFTYAGNDSRDYEKFEKSIEEVINFFAVKKDIDIIVKVHPAPSYFDISKKINSIDSKIKIYKNQNVLELMKYCDSLISINYSTILLEAMTLNIPAMCVSVQRQNFINEPIVKSNSVLYIEDVSEIKLSLQKFLFDKNVRKELVSFGNQFVNNYISNKGNASDELLEILKKY